MNGIEQITLGETIERMKHLHAIALSSNETLVKADVRYVNTMIENALRHLQDYERMAFDAAREVRHAEED